LAATLAAGAWHQHDKLSGHVCWVCHVAHVSLLQPKACLPSAPLVVVGWYSPSEGFDPYLNPFLSSGQSRAPPAYL
jgi:hypothetical protein